MSATFPLGAQGCPRDWRNTLAQHASWEPSGRPVITAVSRITTAIVVVLSVVLIVSQTPIHAMCADSCRSCADVVECRRHRNVVKSAVQTTLAPGTCAPQWWLAGPPQYCPSLHRGSRDISYYVMAMFFTSRGECCQTKPKFWF
uniref:Uncharacterized protein n=1 Tax=Ixodes ricinus TaxID=34613 RepID=A0A6B0UUA1_IXORI